MSLGFGEIAILAVILLLFFGAGKIPKLMGDLAGGIKEFKKGMREEMAETAAKPADPAPAPAPASAFGTTSTAAPGQAPIIDAKAEPVPPTPPRV
ncbi:MAG: twin-arginine translocase TatA/TatE family subunit [Tagaea sp.]|nr:twin-arginine translocase TatA/TatE family subunit [Azospirillum sp.]MCA3268128.1 twin-arginine translocase TatA/TatE family subunit [Azospirillum sp.]MCZ8121824.1 twin-arginine translocase TatA/TatE family subunit [Magnetospirillum sp.]